MDRSTGSMNRTDESCKEITFLETVGRMRGTVTKTENRTNKMRGSHFWGRGGADFLFTLSWTLFLLALYIVI